MRVLLGLAAFSLAVGVNGQQTVSLSTPSTFTYSASTTGPNAPTSSGTSGGAYVNAYIAKNSTSFVFPTATLSPIQLSSPINTFGSITGTGSGAVQIQAATYTFYVPVTTNNVLFWLYTNAAVSQILYKYQSTSYGTTGAGSTLAGVLGPYYCDPCCAGSTSYPAGTTLATTPLASTTTSTGACVGVSALAAYPCANFQRLFLYSGLVAGTSQNSLQVAYSDYTKLTTVASMYILLYTPVVSGDPQIVGMQGQDFQVHGMPDEIFNIVTYPTVQVNARFTYLEQAECHDNFTACFAHPGTYISEQGFRLGKDKIRVTAGTFKKGLTVHVNGKKTKSNVDLKSGAVEIINHRRIVVHTDIMRFTVSNSDKFLNQEMELKDDKLVALGAERRQLKDNQRFHPEVPLHGLQGQTWRNVEYASGLEYEGSIMDYHVVDGNLYGTDFVFNQFQA